MTKGLILVRDWLLPADNTGDIMKVDKSLRREQQLHKRRTGMKVTGKSVFILQNIIKQSGEKASKPTR